MSQNVLSEIDHGVGIVTLNRPERRNAFDEEFIAELTAALRALGERPDVRAVVLSATGESFCAGADLDWMRRAAQYAEEDNLRDARALAELLRTLDTLPKPTLARVHGAAYGGGVGLVAACDIALATYDAQFSLSEVRLGLIPSVISPYVAAAMGARAMRRYMLTAEVLSAAEAYRLGLVHEIVPDEQALDGAMAEIIDRLLASGPQAQAECKSLLAAVAHRPIDDALIDDTAQRIARVRAGAEAREGIAAFLEKRRASWRAS